MLITIHTYIYIYIHILMRYTFKITCIMYVWVKKHEVISRREPRNQKRNHGVVGGIIPEWLNY